MYEYKAKVDRLIDGDTVVLIIDLGFNNYTKVTGRLEGIDTPEIRGKHLSVEDLKRGHEATHHLEELCSVFSPLTVKTKKDRKGSFGRYLITIYGVDPQEGYPVCINDLMVKDGYAIQKDY